MCLNVEGVSVKSVTEAFFRLYALDVIVVVAVLRWLWFDDFFIVLTETPDLLYLSSYEMHYAIFDASWQSLYSPVIRAPLTRTDPINTHI